MDLHKKLVGALDAIILGLTALVTIALLAALAGPAPYDQETAAGRVLGAARMGTTSGPREHA